MEDVVTDEEIEEIGTSIRDIIKGRSISDDETTADSIENDTDEGFVLPVILAPTGASL